MAAPKAHERDRELLTLLRKWKGVEATTIKSCDSHHYYTDECDQERFPKTRSNPAADHRQHDQNGL
jgi:hypothetical protein